MWRSGNSLTFSNQTVTNTTGASVIGSGSSNNVLTILTNTVWNGGAQATGGSNGRGGLVGSGGASGGAGGSPD